MRRLIIERSAIRSNMAVIKERAQGAALYGVVSGQGGGVGAVRLARLLRDAGVTRFGVNSVEEAQLLRESGFETEEILMLRSTVDREELERLVDLSAVCTVSSVDTGLALNAVAENRSTVAEAHIQVDTGLGFGGFLISEPEKILLAYRSLPNVALSGIYTQLHAVTGKSQEVDGQLKQFQQVLEAIHQAGFETGTVHAAGSFALMHFDCARLDAVRARVGHSGPVPPHKRGHGLTTVGYGEATITEVRWLPKGHTVGADKLITNAKGPPGWPLLPVGYQNGLGGAPQKPGPAGHVAGLAAQPQPHRAPQRPAGAGYRLHRSLGNHLECHRCEMLRRGRGRLRPGPPLRPGHAHRISDK